VPVSFLFFLIGTAMFAYYQARPDLLPAEIAARPNQILPFFIVKGLPVVITGLLIAAIFAAGMTRFPQPHQRRDDCARDYFKRFVDPGVRGLRACAFCSGDRGIGGAGRGLRAGDDARQERARCVVGDAIHFSGGMLACFCWVFLPEGAERRGGGRRGAGCAGDRMGVRVAEDVAAAVDDPSNLSIVLARRSSF
jgi:hypothetical protein